MESTGGAAISRSAPAIPIPVSTMNLLASDGRSPTCLSLLSWITGVMKTSNGSSPNGSSPKASPASMRSKPKRVCLQPRSSPPSLMGCAACPFDFGVDVAIAHVRERAAADRIDPGIHFHREHRHLSVQDALAELDRLRPATEDLVVCHGDYCLPNILIDGEMATGFLDLGELAVADRWWDLAVATWSLTWNLGPGWERHFLDAYDVDPNPRKQAFYRLLYDVAS